MTVSTRPANKEHPPQTDKCIDATLYIKLKTTLEVIFVSGWGEFILNYQINELDDRISKIEKGQNITKTVEETALELDGEMSMDANLIGKFITQKVVVEITNNTNNKKRRSRNLGKVEETECQESLPQKTV